MEKEYVDMVTLIGHMVYEPFKKRIYHIPDEDITMNRLYSIIEKVKSDRRFSNIKLYFRVIDKQSIDVCYDMIDDYDESPRINMKDDILPFIQSEFEDDGRIKIDSPIREQLWCKFE